MLRHMLGHGAMVGITEDRLRRMNHHIKSEIVKMSEKVVGKKSLVWSLIRKVFAEKTEDEKMEILIKCTGPQKFKDFVPDDVLDEALKSIPHLEVKSDFDGLRQRLDQKLLDNRFKQEVTRRVGERAERENSTPQCVKDLKPNWKGCGICMDFNLKSFEGYYPAGKPTTSVAMKWEGSSRSDGKLAALSYVLDFLWSNHIAKGRVSWLFFGSV